jgi:hypothetical protein
VLHNDPHNPIDLAINIRGFAFSQLDLEPSLRLCQKPVEPKPVTPLFDVAIRRVGRVNMMEPGMRTKDPDQK